MIHAGPGGIILDSKVAPKASTSASTLGQGSTFAGFNNSFNGDAAGVAAAAAENTPTAGLRQRPPATKNAASETADPLAALTGAVNAQDPNNPNGNPPAIDPATGQPMPIVQNAQAANGNGITTLADQLNNTNPKAPETAQGNAAVSGNPGQPVGNQGPVTNGNQLTTGGGIAGVASNAEGKGIKLVNEQSKYKLWEFYYDLRKDQNSGAAGLGQTPANTANTSGTYSNTQTQSAFGTSTTFGPSTQQQTTQPQTQPPTMPQ